MQDIRDGADVSAEIAKLPSLSREELLKLWEKHYRKSAPRGIRRELMVPFLAYRIQENRYGGLKPSTRAELRRIVRNLGKDASNGQLSRPRMKPGTRLYRRWRGETHEVVVTDSGFEYRGAAYQSLSEIARKITGTRWSGPAFFGLKKLNPEPGHPDD